MPALGAGTSGRPVPPIFSHSENIPESEDYSSFQVSWGIRKIDSIVGDPQMAKEWSKSTITPRDQVQVVENSDQAQLESIGCHDIALISSFFFFYILVCIIHAFATFLFIS